MSSTLFNAVPPNYVLTSGANSALTWTNAISVSSMNISSLGANALTVSTLTTSSAITTSSISVNSVGANALTVSTLTTSSLLTASTISATRLNYSSLVGSTVSTNTLTLSAVNTSTQNTQIYQTATTNPVTSYSVIQASHVSTGITNNNLALNPSGGNVGVGTATPAGTLHVSGPGASASYSSYQMVVQNSSSVPSRKCVIGVDATATSLQSVFNDNATAYLTLNPLGGNVGISTNGPASLCHIGSPTDNIYPNNPLGNNTVTIFGPARAGPTPAGRSDLNGTLFVNATSAYGANVGASIALGGRGDNFGSGNLHMTFARISGVQALENGAYYGNFKIETQSSGVLYERMRIDASGGVYLSAYTTNGTVITINSTGQLSVSSDRRIKENIVYQSDTQQGLASVLNLKPATYRLIGSSDSHLGFIAQDLEQEIPLAVDGKKYEWQWETTEDNKPKFDANGDIVYKLDEDGNKIVRPRGVSDRAIIATQTLAIQELAKRATLQDALVQELSKQLTVKSAALDALIAWAQTQGYVA